MGREFLDIFEEWADSYDKTVEGHDLQYKEVFEGYEEILTMVCERSSGTIWEFGSGTGNLSAKLVQKGYNVIGIEPSKEMRAVFQKKFGESISVVDGDFLSYSVDGKPDTIVSTYAFHHLTDTEKAQAFHQYGNLLNKGGKIVFADTMYLSSQAYSDGIEKAEKQGFEDLAQDLKREHYTTIPALTQMAEEAGFSVTFIRCNAFVWLMEAIKQ
ncbi:class I SAM-dependent DNA methyltransferase [Bacillus sp. 2205SS5-2]|uniref:class I SAM-dependent DNA methyltransferase n=1 Tax=Bacillus sp. 2205SS5-2 TaxID=3109031 RepID=UPI0030048944